MLELWKRGLKRRQNLWQENRVQAVNKAANAFPHLVPRSQRTDTDRTKNVLNRKVKAIREVANWFSGCICLEK